MLEKRPIGTLTQYHAWPDRFAEMARQIAATHGAAIPAPARAVPAGAGSLLRIHPQRLWHVAESAISPQALSPDVGVSLDLSLARAAIHVAASMAEPAFCCGSEQTGSTSSRREASRRRSGTSSRRRRNGTSARRSRRAAPVRLP
jgi:hypothetical protein